MVVIRLCGSASRALPPFSDFPQDLCEIVYGGAYMLSGGLEYSGEIIAPISEKEIRGCVQEILKLDPPVRNLVISGAFSPRDDPLEGQEVQAGRIVRDACPDISFTLSHGVRTIEPVLSSLVPSPQSRLRLLGPDCGLGMRLGALI